METEKILNQTSKPVSRQIYGAHLTLAPLARVFAYGRVRARRRARLGDFVCVRVRVVFELLALCAQVKRLCTRHKKKQNASARSILRVPHKDMPYPV